VRALPLRSRARGHRGAVARSGAPATAPPRALALPHPPPRSKVACETAAKTGMIMIFGEITTKAVRARGRAARSGRVGGVAVSCAHLATPTSFRRYRRRRR
jgi:hypothetical protein